MSSLKLFFFGAPRVERNDQPIAVRRRKGMALLAYLALTERSHSREMLSTLLWPEFDHSRARGNLRRELSRLKRDTGLDLFLADRRQLSLDPQVELWVDVERFEAQLQIVAEHEHFPSEDCNVCQRALGEAVSLYADDFMAGFTLADAPAFDEWHFFQGESLRQQLAEALQKLIEWHSDRGEYAEAANYGRRWLALDPLHEPAHRALMALYARDGQQAAALRQYEECARLLEEELGVEPEPATRELHEAIRLRQFPPTEPAPSTVSAPASLAAAERYVMEERLAVGGQGEVFRGRDQLTGEPVIVKRLRPELVVDEERVARFLREGEALGQLAHPNIVRMLAAYSQKDQHYIVMEYVPGGTLRDMLEEAGALPVPQVLEIALELADALSRAHHLGIVHRDLKPENVLLAADGAPRLTDFGMAGIEEGGARLTRTGAILGSPAYMSPEALRGETLTARSDIWSFGVMLFEMLSGSRPFEGEHITQILMNILNEPAPELTKRSPGALPPALVALVQRMLVKEAAGRTASMRQVASALEAIGAGRMPIDLQPLPASSDRTAEPGPPASPEAVELQPSRSLPREPANRLPAQTTPFIGREQELEMLGDLISHARARVVTIVGVGGTGKTRLALAAAERLLAQHPPPYPDGVYFVPLAPLGEARQVAGAVADALGLSLIGEGDQPRRELLDYLRGKQLLLLLDNAEHLLDDVFVGLLSELLQAAPGVRLLVTSRTRLNVLGEQLLRLEGLQLPVEGWLEGRQPRDEASDLDAAASDAAASDAVQLFYERARRVHPDFDPDGDAVRAVVRICRLVAGMPLAIELAAAWVEVLSPREIVAEIEGSLDFLETEAGDVPARQRSLRAVFDSSWRLLNEEEQDALKGLSVFRDRASREAAQAVASASLRMLLGLANKSWIQRSGERYQMHALLRQYALEKLQTEPEAWEAARDKHAGYYAAFLEEQEVAMKGPAQEAAFTAVAEAFANLRDGWQWLVRQGQLQPLVEQMLPGLYWYCEARARGYEFMNLVEEALQLATSETDRRWRGALLTAKGAFYRTGYPIRFESFGTVSPAEVEALREAWSLMGGGQAITRPDSWDPLLAYLYGRIVDRDAGIYQMRQLVAHFREQGQRWELGFALHYLAQMLQLDLGGEGAQVEELLAEALALFDEQGDTRESGYVMRAIGQQHRLKQELEEAILRWEAAQALLAQVGDWAIANDIHWQIGDAHLQLGQFEEAFDHYRRMSDTYLQRGRRELAGRVLSKESYESARYGNLGRARQARQQALALARQTEDDFDIAWSTWEMGELERIGRDLDSASRWFEEARHLFLQLRDETGLTFYHRALGDIALARGGYLEAQQAFQESLRHAQATDHPWAMAYAWSGMGRASLGLEHVPMAHHHFLEALRHARATGDRGITLLVLAGVAAFLMAAGETTRGLELTTFVAEHPLTWREVKERMAGLLATAAELPPSRLEAARRAAGRWEIWSTVDRLIEWLKAAPQAHRPIPSRLPQPPSPFVGRKKELADVRRLLLSASEHRLLTFVGPGGIGKTRLALEAAARSGLSFPDGTFFVSISPPISPEELVAAIAASMELPFTGAAEPIEQLLDFLRDKRVLLVLDDLEEVVQGATVILEILQAAPLVCIIVTSRESLNVSGETVYRVQGLSVPPGEALAAADAGQYEAVDLLLQQARRVQPGFVASASDLRHAARIVRLVQGMPLALVMAAGWLELLSLEEIAEEIAENIGFLESTARDLPERQRSIRATFDYSWQRLPAGERRAFMKLSVFEGGFSRAAAEAVAGAGLRTLRTLVNKSFLSVSDQGRFDIHELLRQYGLEQLKVAEAREEAEAAHSAYFLAALGEREAALKGKGQLQALAEIEADLENVRAAWEWALARKDGAALNRGLGALETFLGIRNRYHEAVQLFERSRRQLAGKEEAECRRVRRRLVSRLAFAQSYLGVASPETKGALQQALAEAQAEGDRGEEALAWLYLGCYTTYTEKDPGGTLAYLEKSLALARELGDHFLEGWGLLWLGFCNSYLGDYDQAYAYMQETLEVTKIHGDQVAATLALHNLAARAIHLGEYEAAGDHLLRALEGATAVGRRQTEAHAKISLGLLAFLQGQVDRARSLAQEGRRVGREFGLRVTVDYAEIMLALCDAVEGEQEVMGHLKPATEEPSPVYGTILPALILALSACNIEAYSSAWEYMALGLEAALARGYSAMLQWFLPVASVILAARGEREEAVELLGRSEGEEGPFNQWRERWAPWRAVRQRLQTELGEGCYQEAWRRGRDLRLEMVVTKLLASAS